VLLNELEREQLLESRNGRVCLPISQRQALRLESEFDSYNGSLLVMILRYAAARNSQSATKLLGHVRLRRHEKLVGEPR
jgi:hypothetical protein